MINFAVKNNELINNIPKVSIVVATYRRKDTLKNALQSLIKQTYTNIEIIVVDDNADILWNSAVRKIINQINSEIKTQVVYIINEHNQGSAKTRNIGIDIAKGDYITFLDDDDIYLADKVKIQVEHMMNMESDYSLTDLWLYNEKGKLIERRNRKYISSYRKKDLLRYHLLYHMTGTDTLMFKKEYLLSIGGFSPIDIGDEFYLILKAIEKGGKLSYLPRCDLKAYIHMHSKGLSSGMVKINGEKILYEFKKKYFSELSDKDIRFIKMRHYAVLAFAELRNKKIINFFKNLFCSFFISPLSFFKLIMSLK